MRISTKLIILELLGGIFGWIWIGASIASLYFLYVALANDAAWSSLLWSVGIGFISKRITYVLNENQHRIHYVDQLVSRGHTRGEAASAWLTAMNGGLNLLLNMQQSDESVRLEAIETPSVEANKV